MMRLLATLTLLLIVAAPHAQRIAARSIASPPKDNWDGSEEVLRKRLKSAATTLERDLRLSRTSVLTQTTHGRNTYYFGVPGEAPANERTVYEIASLSKIFTGILLARTLEQYPAVTLETRVGTLIPELAESDAGKATLLDLGLHRSGLPTSICTVPSKPECIPLSLPTNPYSIGDAAKMLAAVSRIKIIPATESPYSDLGYAILGVALERIHGKTYETLLEELITKPLGMLDTGADRPDLLQRTEPGRDVVFEVTAPWEFGPYAPGTGLRSTPHDMALFLAKCITPGDDDLGRAIQLSAKKSLGWDSPPGSPKLFKNGGSSGYSAWIYVNTRKNVGVVTLGGINAAWSEDLFYAILENAQPEARVPAVLPSAMIGTYVSKDDGAAPIHILMSGGHPSIAQFITPDGSSFRINSVTRDSIALDDGWTPEWETDLVCKAGKCKLHWTKGGKEVVYERQGGIESSIPRLIPPAKPRHHQHFGHARRPAAIDDTDDLDARIRRAGESLARDLRFSRAAVFAHTPSGDFDYRFSAPGESQADDDTVYEVASLSKVFTGVLLALTTQNNFEYQLETRVGTIIPELADSVAGQATLEELATHRSGLPEWICIDESKPNCLKPDQPGNPYSIHDEAALLRAAAEHPIDRSDIAPPRDYSDLGFAILGIALERIYKKPYGQILFENIARPLGMKDTGTDRDDLFARTGSGNNQAFGDVPPWLYELYSPGAGVRTTARDMRLFLAKCADPGNDLLGAAIKASFAHGLGWDSAPGSERTFKNAGAGGYSAWLWVDVPKKIGMFALNAINSSASEELLYSLLQGREAKSHPPAKIPPKLVGKFVSVSSPRREVELRFSKKQPTLSQIVTPAGTVFRIDSIRGALSGLAAGAIGEGINVFALDSTTEDNGVILVDDGWSHPWPILYSCGPKSCALRWSEAGVVTDYKKLLE